MSSNRLKLGLACAGGVVEGAIYEVGVLCALEDALEDLHLDRLDVYVGVSAGSLIVSHLANGVTPRQLVDAVLGKADDEALNMRYESLFHPAWSEYARRISRVPGVTLRALSRYVRQPLDPLAWIGEVGRLLPVGVFDGRGFEGHVRRSLSTGGRTNDFRELGTKLRVVTTQVDSAHLVAFGEPGTDHVPISKAVQASTALPGLYCPVEIDGRHYMDGVARRTVHASLALDEGVDLLLCVNPIVPVDTTLKEAQQALGGAGKLVEHGLPTVLSQTFRTLVYSRARAGFRRYAHVYPNSDVVLIEPTPADYARIFSNIFSASNRHAVLKHAYATTLRTLRERQAELGPIFARHGLTLRSDVLAKPTTSPFDVTPPAPEPPAERTPLADAGAVLQRLDTVLQRLDEEIERQAA